VGAGSNAGPHFYVARATIAIVRESATLSLSEPVVSDAAGGVQGVLATLRQAQRERDDCVAETSGPILLENRAKKFLRTRILIGALGRSGGSGDHAVGVAGTKE
jgi:hypothetical protein